MQSWICWGDEFSVVYWWPSQWQCSYPSILYWSVGLANHTNLRVAFISHSLLPGMLRAPVHTLWPYISTANNWIRLFLAVWLSGDPQAKRFSLDITLCQFSSDITRCSLAQQNVGYDWRIKRWASAVPRLPKMASCMNIIEVEFPTGFNYMTSHLKPSHRNIER